MKVTAWASRSCWPSSSLLVSSSPTRSQRWSASSERMWVGNPEMATVRLVQSEARVWPSFEHEIGDGGCPGGL